MSKLRVSGLALCLALAAGGVSAAPSTLVFDNPFRTRGDANQALSELLDEIARAPQSAALPLLLGELERARRFVPHSRETVRQRLGQVVEALGPHPNRDDLQQALVRLHFEAGDRERALAVQQSRGFLRTWNVVGFFGYTAGAFEQAWAPELSAQQETLDLNEAFEGARQELGWRPLVFAEPDSISARLGEVLGGNGVAYAVTHVKLAEATDAQLVYRGPSVKAWVNLHPVVEVDRVRERTDAELRFTVRLQAGWNRIVLKLVGNPRTRFLLRATDDAGTPLPLEGESRAERAVAAPSTPSYVRSSWAVSALSQDLSLEGRMLYAYSLSQGGRGEEGLLAFDDTLASHPQAGGLAWVRLLEASLAQRADHLPESLRRQRAQRALEGALKLDPAHVGAQRELAEFSLSDDRDLDGIQRLEAILSAAPHDVATRLRLVGVLMGKGWILAAERTLEEAEKLHPFLPGVLDARARIFRARGDELGEQASRELLFADDRGRLSTALARVDLAFARGDLKAAAKAAAGLEALGVSSTSRDRIAARLAVARGDTDTELRLLRERLAERPWDDARKQALADALIQAGGEGREREARGLLDGLLEEQPGRHRLRALRDGLAGQEDRFWEEWTPTLAEVLEDAPDPSHWPRSATVCLFDQTVTRVYPDGSSEDAVHQVWRVLTQEGVERYGSRPQAGRLLTIRTITPAGEVLEPIRAGNTFEMPGLAPGAIVEHAFHSQAGAAPLQYSSGPFYFQDPDLTEPFWLSRWVIWIHEDAPVEVVQKNMRRKGILVKRETRGPWKIHVFTARDQPRREREPMAPHRDEVLPWVKLVERVSLEALGEFNRTRAILAQQVTPSVSRTAERLLDGVEGQRAQAEVLFRFVHDHVTRQGNGTRPAEILAARAGSKTSLYLALLRAAGVPHRFAMVARPRGGSGRPVNWALPELGYFLTPLIRLDLPSGQQWVFAEGPPGSPFAELPSTVWGATAYVCLAGGGSLDVVPSGDPRQRTQRTTTVVNLGADRSRFDMRRVLPDYGLYGVKERFSGVPQAQLRQLFARQANELYPSAQLLGGTFERLTEPGVPLTIQVSAEGQLVTTQGGRTLLAPPFALSQLARSLGAFPRRSMDLVLDTVSTSDEAVVELGPYRCPRVPDPVVIVTPFGQFSLYYRQEPGQVRIERSLELYRGRISPKRYAAFRAFLQRVDEAESQALLLAPGA